MFNIKELSTVAQLAIVPVIIVLVTGWRKIDSVTGRAELYFVRNLTIYLNISNQTRLYILDV